MTADNTTNTTSVTDVVGNVRIATVVIYSIISVVGTIGNGLVIYVTGFKMKRTVNSVWFLNLALADFLFTAFLIFTTVSRAQDYHWPFGLFMCRFNTFVTVVNMFASIFLLMTISLDRCLCIWVVVWAQNKRTVCKAQFISAIIWVAAVLHSIPYATYREIKKRGDKTYCGIRDSNVRRNLNIVRLVIGFLIPFLVILVSYVAIGVRAGRLQRMRKRRSRRIIFSVILAFFLCWLPFHFVQFVQLKGSDVFQEIVRCLTVSLAFFNSCLNPILYVFMCDEFQKKLKKSICFVLESALAEDQLSFMSSRSLSSHLSRISRKSGSIAPLEKERAPSSTNSTENKVYITEERETVFID
ncbi:C3a anaphylatoxin chemotactic receptor-like [Anabas testudineus]|uniref:G-protein coupled receptors family 1 profile domain-containing protein n=1 Tax=Anabas testudineus TaxID=64144 RepID=A0A7N6ADT4_ANATE|nr:C3a anaphylatoxin chemotactic receptor-like [Anabas testudineus]